MTAEVASQDMVMYQAEIASKRTYRPNADEQAYVNALKSEFTVDCEDDQRAYDFWQRKSKTEWMRQNQEDSYALYYLTKKDPWRSNIREMTIPQKIDLVMGAIGDLNLVPETHSRTLYGQAAEQMGDAMDVLMQDARIKDRAEEKFMSAARYLLTYGTVCRNVAWRVTKTPDKIITREYPDGRCDFRDTGSFTTDERVWTDVDPFNRVIWGDVGQKYADLQPRKWRIKVVPYSVFRATFKDNPNFPFVKPTKMTGNTWIDLDTQNQIEWAENAWWVILLEYENIFRNVYAVTANGVLMTTINRPLPGKYAHKKYSHTLNQCFELDPGFFAGDSLVRRLHNDASLVDFFVNALVDYTRQDLVPPIIVSFRNAVNRSMYQPGAITRASGDFKVQSLLENRHGFDEAMALTKFISDNLDKTVRQTVQNPKPNQLGAHPSATQIVEQAKENLQTLFTIFMAVSNMERDTAELMQLQILDHYPSMGIGPMDTQLGKIANITQVYSSKGSVNKSGKMGQRQVAFADIPQDKPGFAKLQKQISLDQKTTAKHGNPSKWFLMDRKEIDNYQHMVFVTINQEDRKSKKADTQKIIDNATQLQALLGGQTPEALVRQVATSMGLDPDEVVPQQPTQGPQMPNGGQTPPQAAPMPPQAQPQNQPALMR